jgi:hypothetical protein
MKLGLVISLVIAVVSTGAAARATAQIAGCYSDLRVIDNEGLVVGTGSFRIRKDNGKYFATFTELLGDGGRYSKPKPVRNLHVDDRNMVIRFDLSLESSNRSAGTELRNVTGRISKRGIKMIWRGQGTDFGTPNPFLQRRAANCT